MASQSYKTNRSILLGQDNNALVFVIRRERVAVRYAQFSQGHLPAFRNTGGIFLQTDPELVHFARAGRNIGNKAWVLLTYMFTHYNIWHLISSCLWLWCFGYILQDLTGNNKLIPVYLYGGFVGGIIFVLMNNLVPGLEKNLAVTTPMLGAGAAIMAVAVATTTLAPDYRIFPMIGGGIPLWVLTLIFVAIDFATVAGGNAGTSASHLAAGVIGFFFIRQLRRGKDWGAWMNHFVDWLDDLFRPEKKHTKQPTKDKLFYQAGKKPYEKISNITQQRLDAILDKINQKGYQFLTDEEKAFLKRASDEEL